MIIPFRLSSFAAKPRFVALFAFVVLVGLSLPPRTAHADETDSQLWTLLTANKRFSNGVRLYGEIQPRVGNHFQDVTQLLIRPAVGYQVNPTVSLWMGYGWTPSISPRYVNEHRIFQQVLVENRYTNFDLTNRTRLEERFISGAGETAYRFRHQIRFYKPLDAQKRWGAVLSDELFIHLNTTPNGPQAGFDQNRPYIGIARQINKHTRVEAGYQGTTVNPRNRPNRRLDTLLLTANYNF